MENFINKLKIRSVFGLLYFTFPCLSWAQSSNFILVSSRVHATFVDMKSPKNFTQSQENLIYSGEKAQTLFSFYSSSDSLFPKVIFLKNNKVFINSGNRKFHTLGLVLPSSSRHLWHMENSVEQGHILVGYKDKLTNQPTAFVQDNNGVIYCVTRLSHQHFSIQPLGKLASNT